MRLQELVQGLWVGLKAIRTNRYIDAVRVDCHRAGCYDAARILNFFSVTAHDVFAPKAIGLLEHRRLDEPSVRRQGKGLLAAVRRR